MSSILQGLQLNELSNKKLGDYKIAAGADATAADKKGDTKKADKRFSGIVKATKKQFANGEKKEVAEGAQRVDSLVTDALKIMRGSEVSDAVSALKTVLGDREYNGRRGFYNFYIKQMIDMYRQQGVAEGEVVPLGKKHRGDLDSVNSCSKCGGKLEGGTYMGQRIKVCLPCKQVYLPPNSGIDQQGNKIKEQGVAEGSGGNWYIRVNGKILNDTKFKPVIFSSEDEARSHAMKLADKKRIPLSQIKLTKSWMDAPEPGVAEGAPELLKKEMPLHRHAEKLLAQNGVSKDDPDYHHHLGNTIKHLRQFGNIDLINKQGVAEGLVKDIKRLATGKDVKSRAGQEIAKSQDASMKGDNKTSKKHFDRYDKLDKLANKEQGVAEGDVVQFPQKHPWYAAKTCPKCEGSLVGGKTAEGRVKYCMGCGTVYPEPNTNKGVAEGSEFGATYAEQLAQMVFNVRPKLASEDDVLNIGHKVATQDLMSQVRANYLFARDQDFPSDFVSAYYYLQKRNLNEFAPVGGDDREPDEEEILRQLAKMWWLGTEQEMAKAQKTLAAMGWEIGQDESGDDDAGVFVIRAGDEHGDSYIAFNHSDLEELNEAYNNYQANRTGFSRGQRDDERHDLDTPTQVWGLKINGKVWSKAGKSVTFTSKEAALNTRNAILKNRPDLEIGLVTKGGMAEEKQRLDPSCWKGYRKAGTKMKGDTRVNNCVPVKESSIMQGVKQLDEGWKEKLGAAALAGSMALGSAGAQARVTPDGQGGFTGGLKPTATVTAPSDNKPAAEAPKGFSKEYLQKAADPNRTGRYMISVEKAQELLKQGQGQ